jgi:lipoate-protein ligase A
MDIKSTSPDSELKRYIEESIKNIHKDNEPDSNEPPFMSEVYDSLLKAFSEVYGDSLPKEDNNENT